MHRLSITLAAGHKKGAMHLLRSALRQPRNGNLSPSYKYASHLSVYASLYKMNKTLLSETSYHILSLCVVISKKFPRLLAEREIIANAFSIVRISPRTSCKDSNNYWKCQRNKRKYVVWLFWSSYSWNRGIEVTLCPETAYGTYINRTVIK